MRSLCSSDRCTLLVRFCPEGHKHYIFAEGLYAMKMMYTHYNTHKRDGSKMHDMFNFLATVEREFCTNSYNNTLDSTQHNTREVLAMYVTYIRLKVATFNYSTVEEVKNTQHEEGIGTNIAYLCLLPETCFFNCCFDEYIGYNCAPSFFVKAHSIGTNRFLLPEVVCCCLHPCIGYSLMVIMSGITPEVAP